MKIEYYFDTEQEVKKVYSAFMHILKNSVAKKSKSSWMDRIPNIAELYENIPVDIRIEDKVIRDGCFVASIYSESNVWIFFVEFDEKVISDVYKLEKMVIALASEFGLVPFKTEIYMDKSSLDTVLIDTFNERVSVIDEIKNRKVSGIKNIVYLTCRNPSSIRPHFLSRENVALALEFLVDKFSISMSHLTFHVVSLSCDGEETTKSLSRGVRLVLGVGDQYCYEVSYSDLNEQGVGLHWQLIQLIEDIVGAAAIGRPKYLRELDISLISKHGLGIPFFTVKKLDAVHVENIIKKIESSFIFNFVNDMYRILFDATATPVVCNDQAFPKLNKCDDRDEQYCVLGDLLKEFKVNLTIAKASQILVDNRILKEFHVEGKAKSINFFEESELGKLFGKNIRKSTKLNDYEARFDRRKFRYLVDFYFQ